MEERVMKRQLLINLACFLPQISLEFASDFMDLIIRQRKKGRVSTNKRISVTFQFIYFTIRDGKLKIIKLVVIFLNHSSVFIILRQEIVHI
jgi:hypothetical protein